GSADRCTALYGLFRSHDATRPQHNMTEARATILIVDDDISVTWTFARMLRMEGYAVLTAFDAETGLRETAAHQPDAILLDLRMPIMDGVKFLRQLRGREH